MQKVVFTNKIYYILLIAYILILLVYNVFVSVMGKNVLGLIPICIQSLVLIFIMTKNKYAKQVILIWVIVFLVIGSLLQILGTVLDEDKHIFGDANFYQFLNQLVTLIIGVLIITFSTTIKRVGFE
ncbi:hypothetical protein BEL04_04860 [Mucilaginibacter sp. PPCGB 2223]|uniref:hypothetical protein n=1 Tax=Mucilaginibacter sp. PPCGB 2223 TaxID=1886027 RepID=UPI0008252C03|nr:hypothetical protein [Mucilaginibacter sp. PPCGB 2223]OCX53628.1 hypothetical protein BEL04_04860 [Mucilaginibacter sp. PPCGB 2223]